MQSPGEVMRADILVTNANELLTIEGSESPRTKERMRDLGIIVNGAVAVKDGIIVGVGESDELRRRFSVGKSRIINADGKVVMPGFVDCHTHLIFAGSRENEFEEKIKGTSYIEILKKGGGILSTVRATRRASKKELVAQGLRRLDRMLAYGTTTAEAKSGYGLTVKDEIKSLKAIDALNRTHPIDLIPTFLGAHAIPLEYKGRSNDYLNLIIKEMLPRVANLAEFCDVFCEKGVFSVPQARRLLRSASKLGLKPKIHADEIVRLGGTELAGELNAVSAEHLVKTSVNGMRALAEKGAIAVLLPGTPFVLMEKEYADARRMIENGVAVAIATDLNPNCYTESMQIIITLACLQMRMLPSEAIVASTINSAFAIEREKVVGSLEVGKKGDIIILDIENHKLLPYHFGVNLVEKVIKDGRIVYSKA